MEEEEEFLLSKKERKSQYQNPIRIFIGVITVLLVCFFLTLIGYIGYFKLETTTSSTNTTTTTTTTTTSTTTTITTSTTTTTTTTTTTRDPAEIFRSKLLFKKKIIDFRFLGRYLVKTLACSYRDHLYEMAQNRNNSFEDLLEFHRQIEDLAIESGGEPKDPYSWEPFDHFDPIKWNDNVFSIRHNDSSKVENDFLICLPPKTGTSNWQIALAKLFYTTEEMAAQGVVIQEGKENVFYPWELYGMVPRFHTVNHAALLEGKGKRYLNTRDPFTRARSGWRDKIQLYPDDPEHDENNSQFDDYVEEAKLQRGPPAPPKFKVSLEKWLRMLVHHRNDDKTNQHWKSQDGCCHFCAMDYEYILHGRLSEEEWPWVLDKQGLTGILELSPRYGGPDPESGWFTKEAQGFVEIPIDLIKELYRRYYFDFVAAGYSPKFVKKFITAVEEAQTVLAYNQTNNQPDNQNHLR